MTTPSIQGFDTTEVTLKSNSNLQKGQTVVLSGGCSAVLGTEGALFCGICSASKNKYLSVIMKGFATTTYSGTAPSIGYNKLVCDGAGNVMVSDQGRYILVTKVDTATGEVEIIL